jgi:hypothetical protein
VSDEENAVISALPCEDPVSAGLAETLGDVRAVELSDGGMMEA